MIFFDVIASFVLLLLMALVIYKLIIAYKKDMGSKYIKNIDKK